MTISLEGCSTGDGEYLTDRVRETSVEGSFGDNIGFTIDLGAVRKVDGLRLMATGCYKLMLPKGYNISVSDNGVDYRSIRNVKGRMPVSYICGDRVYLKGYLGWMECRFKDVQAQYIRLRFTKGQGQRKSWSINEVFVSEQIDAAPAYIEEDVVEMASVLKDRNIDFAACDRWLSAKLLDLLPVEKRCLPVYPRVNPCYNNTLPGRGVLPRKGLAVVSPLMMADECEQLLKEVYGDSAVEERLDFSGYSILLLGKASPPDVGDYKLAWDGFTLLKTKNPGVINNEILSTP